VTKVLLHHENARRHTSLHTREAITKLQWTVLPHPPYNPDLAPYDYHLFSPLKDAICGKKFENDEEVISEVQRCCDRDLQCVTTKAYRLSHLGGIRP
jgi:histone-lysine N-methyltransferase SETMAR